MKYYKYSGCGNTFLIFDQPPFLSINDLVDLCHAYQCDGAIFLENAKIADRKMSIFNCDGIEASMCGNGLRCVVQYLCDHIKKKKEWIIESNRGLHQAFCENESILCTFPDPKILKWEIEILEGIKGYLLDTSCLHLVLFWDCNEVSKIGSMIHDLPCFHPPQFPIAGVNVNFVKFENNSIAIRTFERGVYAETLACGTGAIASALVASKLYSLPSPLLVQTHSKEFLKVHFECEGDNWKNISLSGKSREISSFENYLPIR